MLDMFHYNISNILLNFRIFKFCFNFKKKNISVEKVLLQIDIPP